MVIADRFVMAFLLSIGDGATVGKPVPGAGEDVVKGEQSLLGNRDGERQAEGMGWVLHVDLDEFIAAVEVLRHPELADKSVIVGRDGDPTKRGVVSTANYGSREVHVPQDPLEQPMSRLGTRTASPITADLSRSSDRRSEGFRVLRKGLAYGWSVAAAAAPDEGRSRMERWMQSEDPDVRWLTKQNPAKRRMAAVGPVGLGRGKRGSPRIG
jgi:hypothetical protein